MTYTGHLLRWDARRLRWILALWTSVVVAYTVLVGLRPFASVDPSARESFAVADSILWLAMMLISFGLVSLVIHAHPTVGSDAFWMTRAIPPGSLLASKLVLISLSLLAVPSVADAVLLATHQMPLSTSAGVIAQETSLRIVLLMLLVSGAVYTRSLAHFTLLCVGILLAIAAAVGTTAALVMRGLEEGPPVRTPARTVEDPSALVIFSALFIVAAVIMLAVQYRTRLKRRSLAVGAGAVGVALLVAWLWPLPFLRHRFVVPGWAGRVAVRIDSSTISTNIPSYAFFASRRHQWSTVNGLIHVDGVGPGWNASVALREASIQLPNGVTLGSPGSASTSVLVGDIYSSPREYRSMRDLLGVQVIGLHQPPRSDPPPRQSHPVLFVFRRDEVAPLLPARGHYRARMDVNLTQFAIHGVIPLRPGASHRNGGYQLVIDRMTTFDNEFAIVAREARATSMWERRPWARYAFYLRNRERDQAVAVNDYSLLGGFTLLRFLPIGHFSIGSADSSGFSSRGMVLRFPPRYTPTAETLDVDDAWLAGAELVIVRRTEEGWIERTVEIPDFPIGQ